MQTVPFTPTQVAQIRYYAGYSAYAAFGYELSPDMATLNLQIAAMSDAEQVLVVSEFLAVLPGLKTALDATTGDHDILSAGPYFRNQNEYADRKRQYADLRRELCAFIGCTPGEKLGGGTSVVPC